MKLIDENTKYKIVCPKCGNDTYRYAYGNKLYCKNCGKERPSNNWNFICHKCKIATEARKCPICGSITSDDLPF